MSFATTKIGRRLEEIQGYIYEETIELPLWEKTDATLIVNETDSSVAWEPFHTDSLWGGYDQFCWFRGAITIPACWDGRRVALYIHTDTDIIWKKAAEYMIYRDGLLLQGADIFHHEVVLRDAALGGEQLQILIRAFSGLSDQPNKTTIRLVLVNNWAERLYYRLSAAYNTLLELEEDSKDYHHKYTVINNTVNMLDLRCQQSPEYYATAQAALEYLEGELFGGRDKYAVTVSGIGHSHIDVAWTWQLKHTRYKSVRNFSTAVNFMNRYPRYRFVQSQPQLYRYVKEDQPELYRRIQEKIAQGQWVAEGGMWIESDCVIPSGESLIRQFLHGKAFFKNELGTDSRVVWLPDAFGFTAALPQIMKKCGMDYFVTSKLSWNQVNDLPMDTFLFVGIDGSEMPSYFLTTPELRTPNIRKELPYKKTYNGLLTPKAMNVAWKNYKQKNIADNVLIAYGWGDGGGGPNKEMLETAEAVRDLDGYYRFDTPDLHSYLTHLFGEVPAHTPLPRWVGELYLECHRGTYTAEAKAKKNNRRAEILISAAEKFSVLASQCGGEYPRAALDEAWKLILLNQFHDIIPGTSIKEVYDDCAIQYRQVFELCQTALQKALATIADGVVTTQDAVLVFNAASFPATSLIELATEGDFQLSTIEGVPLPMQSLENGNCLFLCQEVPANGYRVYHKQAIAASAAQQTLPTGESSFSSTYYSITLDAQGNLTSIFDKVNCRELLKAGCRGNLFQVFEDKPINHNAWDIDCFYEEKQWEINEVTSIECIEAGALRTVIRIQKKFLSSTFSQDIILYNHLPRIDFKTTVDWKQQELLVKVAFPVDVHAATARYEIQFGSLERPTHRNTSWEQARFEVYAHKWADVSEGNFGVSLLNDCKYGYDINGSDMRLTLIKSPIYPNPVSGQERHEFTYSIYSHSGDWAHSDLLRQAYLLNYPLYTQDLQPGHTQGYTGDGLSAVSSDKANVLVDTIKYAENSDDIVVRVFEAQNCRSEVTLRFAFSVAEVYETDMLENSLAPLPIVGDTLQFTIEPFEVKTFKLHCLKTTS